MWMPSVAPTTKAPAMVIPGPGDHCLPEGKGPPGPSKQAARHSRDGEPVRGSGTDVRSRRMKNDTALCVLEASDPICATGYFVRCARQDTSYDPREDRVSRRVLDAGDGAAARSLVRIRARGAVVDVIEMAHDAKEPIRPCSPMVLTLQDRTQGDCSFDWVLAPAREERAEQCDQGGGDQSGETRGEVYAAALRRHFACEMTDLSQSEHDPGANNPAYQPKAMPGKR
jgi:hypothetical protein